MCNPEVMKFVKLKAKPHLPLVSSVVVLGGRYFLRHPARPAADCDECTDSGGDTEEYQDTGEMSGVGSYR